MFLVHRYFILYSLNKINIPAGNHLSVTWEKHIFGPSIRSQCDCYWEGGRD